MKKGDCSMAWAVLLRENRSSSGVEETFSGCMSATWWPLGKVPLLPQDPEGTQKCAKSNSKWQLLIGKWAIPACGKGFLAQLNTTRRGRIWDLGQLVMSSPLNLVINAIRSCLRYKAQKLDFWASENRVQEWCFIMWCTPFHISTSQGWAKIAGS